MQSFRQYRELGRRVNEQLKLHEDASQLPDPAERLSRQSSRQSLANTENFERDQDLEKGRQPRDAKFSRNGVERKTRDERSELQPSTSQEESHTQASLRNPSSSPTDHSSGEEPKEEVEQRDSSIESLSKIPTKSESTVGSKLARTLTGLNVRPRVTKDGGEHGQSIFVVGYQAQEDTMNPHNWSQWKRMYATSNVALIGWVVGAASSIDSSIVSIAAREFGVSKVVESLATGLFLIGFGVGSLAAGPFSETIGRNPVYIATLSLYMVFVMASGLAPNIGAQLAFRFLAGLFGSTPLTCAGGSIADLWNPLERVYSFPIFANAAFMGPVIGPVIGGFIAQSSLVGWRWTEWSTLIYSAATLAIVICFQPETHTPTLLRWKASQLRRITGDKRYVAPVEIRQESFASRLKTSLYRPFRLTATEPIVILVALYLTIIYIVLFTFLDGYEFIFAKIHDTSPGTTGLCFLGIAVGLCISTAFVPLIYSWAKRDLAKIKERTGELHPKLPPEFRLWYAMVGGSIAIPVSLFWMAWTSDSNISIWSPLIASVFFGYGILSVFISAYQYIIDSYEIYAASALASVTLIRYLAAGGMVVVGYPFYEDMGVHYTITIMACLSALMAPVPYVFYAYGEKIRSKSKFAVNMPAT